MAWSIDERFPAWGETGEFPVTGFFYNGGDQVNEKHLDALWNGINGLEEDVQSALNDIDSDADGVVDEADTTNLYKGNDIDSDGDGAVDEADTANLYKNNDIDSDGDGTVNDSDRYDGLAPSDGISGEALITDGTTATWGSVGISVSSFNSEDGTFTFATGGSETRTVTFANTYEFDATSPSVGITNAGATSKDPSAGWESWNTDTNGDIVGMDIGVQSANNNYSHEVTWHVMGITV